MSLYRTEAATEVYSFNNCNALFSYVFYYTLCLYYTTETFKHS